MIDDPYEVLGVSPDASDDEIKQAYRRLAKQYHPDRNPGDEEAARKMQQINAAYEQIKDPDKGAPSGASGGNTAYGPYAGYGGSYQRGDTYGQSDQYQQAAYRYVQMGRYREALNILANAQSRDAQWYYLSALANDGLGNQVTALEHIRRAVSMEPDNPVYLFTLERIQGGGAEYRRQAGNFRGFRGESSPCASLCLCYFLQVCCCRGGCC